MSYNLQPDIEENMETPLHRAIRKNNKTRTMRLWELGWSVRLPDPSGDTLRDIMEMSDNIELRDLKVNVILILKAARIGNTRVVRERVSR